MIPIWSPYVENAAIKDDHFKHLFLSLLRNERYLNADGPLCAQLENRLSEVTGFPQVILTNSGTSALYLWYWMIYYRYNIRTFYLPRYDWIASVTAVQALPEDARIKFIEPKRQWYLRRHEFEDLLCEENCVFTASDINGAPLGYDGIGAGRILHDRCQSFHRGQPLRPSNAGNAAVLSFSGTKLYTSGQGGALLLDDHETYSWIKKAILDRRVLNLRFNELGAAKLLYELLGYGPLSPRKRQLEIVLATYRNRIGDMNIDIKPISEQTVNNGLYTEVLIHNDAVNDILKRLKLWGVQYQTTRYVCPIENHSYIRLPSGPGLSTENIHFVCDQLLYR